MLTTVGLVVTAVAASAVAALALTVMLVVFERDDERRLPWSKGAAATVHLSDTSFRAAFKELDRILWVRTSLIVMAIMFSTGWFTAMDRR